MDLKLISVSCLNSCGRHSFALPTQALFCGGAGGGGGGGGGWGGGGGVIPIYFFPQRCIYVDS